MKKKWIVLIIGILLTSLFSYLALTHPNERIANLYSDFAGWSIGVTGLATILMLTVKKMFK